MNKIEKLNIKNILAEKKLDSDPQFWLDRLNRISSEDVERYLKGTQGVYSFDKLLTLISPAAENYLEQMAQLANRLTLQRFGRVIKLYAPLYVSNHCVNSCLYCGFNRQTDFNRTQLSIDQAVKEADIIATEGFRDILLVSGQDLKFVTVDYLVELAGRLRGKFSSIAVEIYQLKKEEYRRLFEAGVDGVTIYQETYDRQTYKHYHPAGPKADYDKRLTALDDIASAGMRQIGLGALLGLTDWRIETLALGEHAHYLMKKYWQSQVSFSFPRLRPAYKVGKEQFAHLLSDKNLVQMITAFGFALPMPVWYFRHANLLKSVTSLSILVLQRSGHGSKTNPGGYSEDGKESVEQFEVSDDRSPAVICQMLKDKGFEPVWKDWDSGFKGH